MLKHTLSFAVVLLIAGCTQKRAYVFDKITLGTTAKLTIVTNSTDKAKLITTQLWKEIDRLNLVFSRYDKDSELSRLNRHLASPNYNEWFTISKELLYVIQRAILVYKDTGKLFNIGILPLENLWKTKLKAGKIPSTEELSNISKLLDLSNIVIKSNKIKAKVHGMDLDLGGLAKGYIIDKVSNLLSDKYKIKNYIVNIGGDLRVSGTKQERPWKIYLQNPNLNSHKPYLASCNFYKQNLGIATSGSYYRYTMLNGIRYSHILDPITLRPSETDILSATVIAKDAITADAYATAIFIMGYKEATKFLDNSKFTGIIVGKRGVYEKKTVNCKTLVNLLSISSTVDFAGI